MQQRLKASCRLGTESYLHSLATFNLQLAPRLLLLVFVVPRDMDAAAALASEICSEPYNPDGIECNEKVVLYRADLNVPVIHSRITDSSRIDGTLPTLKLLLSKGARVAVISHFGRPNPEKQPLEQMRQEHSLRVVADALAQKLPPGAFQGFAADCIGLEAEEAIAELQPGQVSTAPYCIPGTSSHAGL